MPLRRWTLAAVAGAMLVVAPSARAADVTALEIAPGDTDSAILDTASPTPGTRGPHLIYVAPAERRVNRLLVFLPYGGLDQRTTDYELIGAEAGRLGYHTIVLAYRNDVPIAAAAACGINEAPPLLPEQCARNARMEILDGKEESPVVNVDEANSILNRLSKLLVHLKQTAPEDGWAQFVDADNNTPKWSQTVIAGGSLGAGMAVMIAAKYSVHRVSLFGGWADARHGWVELGATPSANYFSLIHVRDTFYARTCWAYKDLKLVTACPAANPPTLMENSELPFDAAQLIFNLEPQPGETVLGNIFHASTARDGPVRKQADGVTPVQPMLNAWRSTLGDRDADTYLDEVDTCPGKANNQLDDADDDRIGDVCDSTPRGTIAPVITAPDVSFDATGPAGALVAYNATATDDLDGARPVTCVPAPGAFAVGTTTVTCSASDDGGNTANATFTVEVRSAPEQLARLVTKLGGSPQLAALVGGLDPTRPLQRAVACITLRAFVTLVPWVIGGPRAADWIADANRIRAVLACTPSANTP